MKKVFILPLFLITGCSAPIDLDSLKTQLRNELKKEVSSSPSSSVLPEPTAIPSSAPSIFSTPSATPSPSPTPQPTPTPYKLPDETRKAVADAVDAMLALASKTSAGINYLNYSSEVATAKVFIDKAQRQTDYGKHPSSHSLYLSYLEYDMAKNIWKCYFESKDTNNFMGGSCASIYRKSIVENYGVSPVQFLTEERFYVPDIISAAWSKAREKAEDAFKKINDEPSVSQTQPTPAQSSPPQQSALPVVNYQKTFVSGFVEGKGQRVQNATVTIEAKEVGYNKVITTNGNGEYSVDDVPQGVKVFMIAEAPGTGFMSKIDIIMEPNENKDIKINRHNFVLISR